MRTVQFARPVTRTDYRQQLPNVPFNFEPGDYTIIACISNPDLPGQKLYKIWLGGKKFLTLTAEEYGLRFHEVPPQNLDFNMSGAAFDMWDHYARVSLDRRVTEATYQLAMDHLIQTLVQSHRSIKPRRNTGRGRFFPVKQINTPNKVAKLIREAAPPKARPVVSTKALRKLLTERGLRPDLVSAM